MNEMDNLASLNAAPPAMRSPGTLGSGMPGLGGGKAGARRSAEEFESFFVTSMLESMTAGIKTDKTFGGGQGETLYRSMLNQEYGKAIAAHGSFGIADAVQKEILRMQQEARQ